tara:strand:+ start:10866 stop:11135 length:270 start_codon:yes stop_codon:yes gene_type:complete
MINLFKFKKKFKITFLIFAFFASFSFIQIILMPNLFNLYFKKLLLEENENLKSKLIKLQKSSCKKIYEKKALEIDEKSILSSICKIDFK